MFRKRGGFWLKPLITGKPYIFLTHTNSFCFISETTNLIIIAAVSGSLICGLLLVIALGCTCKLYNLRQQQLHGPRHETPLSRVYAEFMSRRAPPPYHEAMLTSRPYEEARREYMERLGQTEERSGSSSQRSRRTRSRGNRVQNTQDRSTETTTDSTQNGNRGNTEENGANTSVTPPTEERTVNSTHSNIERHSSRTALIVSDSDSDTESELGTPSADSVRVHFSEETGLSARFHRGNSPGKEITEGESSSNIPRSSPTTGPDISSLDNATIASCDSVDPSQEEDKNKPREINCALTLLQENPPSNSTCALFIPESGQNPDNMDRGRHDSAGSLDSAGSDNLWGDFTS